MTSASYSLTATLGQSSALGVSSSTSYEIESGFWQTILFTIIGDVNGDGFVDLKDVVTALQGLTGQSPAVIIKEADIDGDGYIGIGEAVMILRRIGE